MKILRIKKGYFTSRGFNYSYGNYSNEGNKFYHGIATFHELMNLIKKEHILNVLVIE